MTGARAPLELADVADPAPPAGGVVVRVDASGVCRSDWHIWTGADPVDLPLILGHEFCGEVVAVGADVRRWRVGDRVIAPFILACGSCPSCARGEQTTCPDQLLPGYNAAGSYAELVPVDRADHNLATRPASMTVDVAAALGCRVTTAWHALTGRAALRAGEWLAVVGAGGVGLSALLLADALGARVVVVDVVEEKLRYAATLGAAAVVDATAADPAEAVREVTGGGAHVAIEALGTAGTATTALRSLRPLGRMVQVGLPAGRHATMELPMDLVYSGQLAVFGTRGMPAWRYRSLFDFLDGSGLDLTPLVARRVALSDATAELAAFDHPGPPGVAVITDFGPDRRALG